MDLLKNFFKGDKVIWIIFLLLCTVSIIEVFSASSTLTYKSGDHWGPITNHLVLLMGGAFIVWIIHNIPCKVFKAGVALLPIAWVLLLIVLGMSAINGASRWIDLGFIQFQPSEVAKMANIIAVAKILSMFHTEDGAGKPAFKWILIVTCPTFVLIGVENLSTAVLLVGSVYLMMFIGRIPMRQMLILTAFGIGSLMLAFATVKLVPGEVWNSIGLHRMTTWQNRLGTHMNDAVIPPEKFDINNDAQIAHANIAIATSNIVGKGPGNSVQRDFLSQAFSDFIYAIIIEELGLVGGACIALLYIILLMRIGKIARGCDKPYYSFLVMGIGILLVTQAMFNMLVAVGIMPVTGQPLPLISKGGTSTLVNCAYIGILLSVSRHVQELKRQEELALQAAEQEHAAGLPDEQKEAAILDEKEEKQ
ncbi:MAG: FtsW/RodA/SpoVE family cell cycle protein [Bacteroidales bacterium]|nr:FtsW/RodA/SpoVE family cell cycle protein [Bacteroidales bacterium]